MTQGSLEDADGGRETGSLKRDSWSRARELYPGPQVTQSPCTHSMVALEWNSVVMFVLSLPSYPWMQRALR